MMCFRHIGVLPDDLFIYWLSCDFSRTLQLHFAFVEKKIQIFLPIWSLERFNLVKGGKRSVFFFPPLDLNFIEIKCFQLEAAVVMYLTSCWICKNTRQMCYYLYVTTVNVKYS